MTGSLQTLEQMLAEVKRRLSQDRLASFRPYPKQREFIASGARRVTLEGGKVWGPPRERLLMAGNQTGKSVIGAYEVACHVTGLYPDWWEGIRYDRPTRWWVASDTGENTRDNCQAKLVGPPEIEGEWGTGFLPARTILDTHRGMGTANLLDSVTVRHVSGGVSVIGFKTYAQGRAKWQGATLDGLWLDEEPPLAIYTEALTRLNAVPDATCIITFTPLNGMSDVVAAFLEAEKHMPRLEAA